ncbi:homeodomain-interacting protein kinase 4-like [Notolabrus celidotus]|uniref:homeodomain-interacting protein kinase 4-like n=1 Tax=Notolabrus celidotus TaxID=1203425 RepID=UPI0014902700|nr:homeodomain-interacting protein kinase 4-like [Notolabrus celidotus]
MRLNELVKKAISSRGFLLDPMEQEEDRSMIAKLSSLTESNSHPLHGKVVGTGQLLQSQAASPMVSILEAISVLHPDKVNVVKFFEMFKDMVWTCLVFEMLDMHLYDLIEERDGKPLCLQEIRPIAQQLLVALDALKSLGIIHTDIKPDNIMMVHKQSQTLRVKLIDFGEAMLASEAEPTMEAQPIGYRSPEIALGLPFHEAIDVWGVGCILAFLYLADHLFQVHCEYQIKSNQLYLYNTLHTTKLPKVFQLKDYRRNGHPDKGSGVGPEHKLRVLELEVAAVEHQFIFIYEVGFNLIKNKGGERISPASVPLLKSLASTEGTSQCVQRLPTTTSSITMLPLAPTTLPI